MNTKNIFKSGALLFALTIILTVVAFAQTTYYVNVQSGLDGNNGLSATGSNPVGPKATINNAIAAASAGDIIVVDYGNGNLYNEDVVVTKKLTFNISANSGTGNPNVRSWVVNNAVASPNNTVSFGGAFSIVNFLDLQNGSVIGASNLTIGGTPLAPVVSPYVKRWATGALTSAIVDSQLKYSGAVDFVYEVTAGPLTTALELPPTSNTTAMKSLTTIGANKLTLNEAKTDAGVLVMSNALDLGNNTLTVKGAANTIGADVTNGTLTFAMAAASSVTGAFKLPNITASGAYTLTLTNITQVGSVSLSSGAGLGTNNLVTAFGDLSNAGAGALNTGTGVVFTVGKVNNSSTGSITVGATASTISDVTNSGAGTITLNGGTTSIASITNSSNGTVASALAGAVSITGDVINNGTSTASTTGIISFASTVGVTVNGMLLNAPTVTGANASLTGAGLITFANGPHLIKGLTLNQPTFGGGIGASASVTFTNNGQITFATTGANSLTLKGGLTVNATNNISDGYTGTPANTVGISGNGNVTFALGTGNYLSDAGISNSSTFNTVTKNATRTGAFTTTNNAQIVFPASTYTIGTALAPIGAISNTSTAVFADGNGQIQLASTGGIYAGAVSASGGDGGATIFGNGNVSVASITNSRTVASNHIQVGTVATVGVSISVTGDVTNSNKSNITFNSYNGLVGETFNIGGTLASSGTGTVTIGGLSTLIGGPAINLGAINLSSGTIDIFGVVAGAATKNVVVNGGASFTSGTLKMGTSAARTLQLGGLSNAFGTATTRSDFSTTNMSNVTLLINATTTAGAQTLTFAPTATAWYGPVSISNTNGAGADPGVIIAGGNFRALNNVTFAGTKPVRIDNVTLFIGGQNSPFAGVGNFTNTGGYTTTLNGFVSMNGNGVAQTVGGAGAFGNFEVDAPNGAGVAGTYKSQFNLTNGSVTGGAAIIFDNSTAYPTIVRNAGTFAVAPTFTSMVNVYYIGLDKGSANELPAAATKLNNLTIATTNSAATSGKGRVQILGLTPTVNGTINVFPNQALFLDLGTTLTMNGAAIQLDGDITNATIAEKLVLARVAGTTITGSGVLPDIQIAAKSQKNMIDGAKGLATGLLGVDGLRSVADDLRRQCRHRHIVIDPEIGHCRCDKRYAFAEYYHQYRSAIIPGCRLAAKRQLDAQCRYR
ncbi:MAG: hypothetical protein NTV54_09295 [Ignavibacteriales bacterium]|nr:hypothetical protein [Ignavibacteriales bacterium]